MEVLMSSARLHLVCLVVCFLLGGNASASPCSLAIDTDVVIAVADSKATMYHSWGGIVLSPGLVHFLKTFVSQCDYSKVRISIVAVSNTVRLLAPFTNNPNDLHLAIQSWRPQFKGAKRSLALRSIRSYFKTDARPKAARIVIDVTPQQSENYFATLSESLQLRADHVAIIGVGYGRYAPSQELMAMTGSRNRVLITANDYFLIYFVKPIKQLICTRE
ncbi:uncharacterized protein LOC124152266 [Haliotis rufescens]|uniref:uncharacterized protein LOC124152266 n=1 Tax=Haliotis rufescens TaxID=6454 RepID=UPI00201F3E1D|nr:uncharacterized protein LOC124152266 [Haliotis rufescens]